MAQKALISLRFILQKFVKIMPLIRKYPILINEKRVLFSYLETAPSVVPNSSEWILSVDQKWLKYEIPGFMC